MKTKTVYVVQAKWGISWFDSEQFDFLKFAKAFIGTAVDSTKFRIIKRTEEVVYE